MKLLCFLLLSTALLSCHSDQPSPQPDSISFAVKGRRVTYGATNADQTGVFNANKYFVPRDTSRSQSAGETWLDARRPNGVSGYCLIRFGNTRLEDLPLPYTFAPTNSPRRVASLLWIDETIMPFYDPRCHGVDSGCGWSARNTSGGLTLTITALTSTTIEGTFSGVLTLHGIGFSPFTDPTQSIRIEKGTFSIRYKREIY